MTLEMAIQQRILNLCDEKNLEIQDLRTDNDIPEYVVSNFKNGTNNYTSLETIDTICFKLGISVADFFCVDIFRNLEPQK